MQLQSDSTPSPAHAALQASLHSPQGVDERFLRIESFNADVGVAIESLVNAVLEIKQAGIEQPEPSSQLATLQAKVRELEQQLHVERTNRDMTQVSQMHPKTRSVVFVGTIYFGDNVKYAWLACRRKAEALGIQCWFLPFNEAQEQLVRSLGGDCFPCSYTDWTPDHVHAALSAGVLVTSDHFLNSNPFAPALMAGARHIQLWHGVSIKEIGFRNLAPGRALSPHYAKVLNTCGPYASFVGTTSTAEPEWRRWFAFNRYAPIGYPRNDVLHREPDEGDLANVDKDAYARAVEARRQGKQVFVYAPTFRDADRKWVLSAGLDAIARAVAKAGNLLIVNLHPVEQPQIPEMAKLLPGVTFVAPRTDAYPLLRQASALITDYSSVMFDFLQLDRPILLFRPDHEAYTQKSRKLFDDKLSVLPGPVVTHATQLINRLGDPALGQKPAHAQARQLLLKQLFDHQDGASGERLLGLIGDELDRLPRLACAA